MTLEEIEKRKPLWQTFSDFWLDNELQDFEYKYTVNLMITSNFSLDELEKIFFEEVAPVVYMNLYSVAGQWDLFHPEWLFQSIIENLKKQENNAVYRAWVKSCFGKFIMSKTVRDNWKKTVELYKKSEK